MQKKVNHFFLTVLFFTCCCYDPGFGQAGTPGTKTDPSLADKTTGFYNVTTFIPVTFKGQFLSGLQTICGYKVNKYLSIGGGIGYERFNSISTYEDFKADLSLLPVFVDIRLIPLTGKFSPVIAVNAGYKVLLNKPSTQVRYDTVYNSASFVPARNDYSEYTIYKQGGPFITAEAGFRAMLFKRVGIYAGVAYSLWAVSGDYHLSDKLDLQGSDDIWRFNKLAETNDNSLAYVHAFLVRLGVCF
jgi:hypothetical protein